SITPPIRWIDYGTNGVGPLRRQWNGSIAVPINNRSIFKLIEAGQRYFALRLSKIYKIPRRWEMVEFLSVFTGFTVNRSLNYQRIGKRRILVRKF
ncbi:hypothetical protein, partial [Alteromonas sp. MmMcT2-5]|uniref:hypothetical protein n=1 Tax=Alteromonas sp. MmMcT2-5 TaxID=2917733 RepID=UPI001EF1A629